MSGTNIFAFELTRPADPTKVGKEAIAMVNWVDTFAKYTTALTPFERVVRDGFEFNFAVEGVPSGPWAALAPQTVRERKEMLDESSAGLVPGFSPEHPILQRTGKYMLSWTDPHDMDAIMAPVQHTYGDLFVHIGSKHPYVEKLSGGYDVPLSEAMYLTGQEYTQSVWDEMGIQPDHPWGNIPPRPVNELFDQFEDRLREIGESWGQFMADSVSAPAS